MRDFREAEVWGSSFTIDIARPWTLIYNQQMPPRSGTPLLQFPPALPPSHKARHSFKKLWDWNHFQTLSSPQTKTPGPTTTTSRIQRSYVVSTIFIDGRKKTRRRGISNRALRRRFMMRH